ncbi:superoxide dismutase [Zopfochytrium polystomum]|nr:superoxide dismutase [Zopfochytrium polystomum]
MPPFTLDPLPYPLDALSPHISAETLSLHYGKHHAGYIDKLNALAASDPSLARQSLEQIVRAGPSAARAPAVYNCAAQSWNHTFYWRSMAPPNSRNAPRAPAPSGRLAALIDRSFGGFDRFKKEFSDRAAGHFGSGWAWLAQEKATGLLVVRDTHDAVSALSDPTITPVLTCDVWEHAYYVDFRNARPKYIETWWALVNWEFAESNVDFSLVNKL